VHAVRKTSLNILLSIHVINLQSYENLRCVHLVSDDFLCNLFKEIVQLLSTRIYYYCILLTFLWWGGLHTSVTRIAMLAGVLQVEG